MDKGLNHFPANPVPPVDPFQRPEDGITIPTPPHDESPTDDIVAPEAVDALRNALLRVRVEGEEQPREWKVNTDSRKSDKCEIHIPCSRKTGNMSITKLFVGNAIYLHDNVWKIIDSYPNHIEVEGVGVFHKAGPRTVTYTKEFNGPPDK